MPTGYTAGVADGKVTTFEEYALECARAFGALIEMRDDPHGTPIRESTPADYVLKRIEEVKAKLDELNARTDTDWAIAYANYVSETIDYRSRSLEKIAEKKKRYLAMLDKAKQFVPPTKEHAEYAKFIVSQIEQSIEFDCSTKYFDNVSVMCFNDWKRCEIEDSAKELIRAEKSLSEEIERCRSRNEWIRQLRAAIAEVE